MDLSCKTSVAERQGRSSSVWSSSTAVPVVTREGSRSTKSSSSAGLSQAKNYTNRETLSAGTSCYLQESAVGTLVHSVFTFKRFGKERVYCGARSWTLSRFSRRKRRSSCARKGSLNSSAGKRPNTNFQTPSLSTAANSPGHIQEDIYPFCA